ncbi:Iron-sulfur assembly protein IscA-like 2, mitochondrial [Cucurbita argyrosperma subsp. argyrosperma]|nr:Iron-sulfur assembly protein IscA-like 2, mitochondrial [Cucurbita argyrosperma subsp. argyrosperma]
MAPRLLIQRLTPFLVARIRENQRLLSSSVSAHQEASSLLASPSPSSSGPIDTIQMTDNCIRRMKELQAPKEEKMLRLSVETGGCSGFQYIFDLDDKTNPDDRVYEKEGVRLVVDNISYDFVKGATIDYVEELIRSAFVSIIYVEKYTERCESFSPGLGNTPYGEYKSKCRWWV